MKRWRSSREARNGPMLRFLICAVIVFMVGARAGAHPSLQDALWVLLEPERIRVAINVSAREIAVAQRIDAAGAGAPSPRGDESRTEAARLADGAQRHRDYILRHLR